MVYITTIVLNLLRCLRSVDIRSEHMASFMQLKRFQAPASLHNFSKTVGFISGCGMFAMWIRILMRSSLKLGQNDAFARRDEYSSPARETPSIVWHSFSATLAIVLDICKSSLSVLAAGLGELKVIDVALLF